MIHLFELLFLFQEEAGRPIKKIIDLHLPRNVLICIQWEPAARAALLHAASNTAAPPTFVRWLPSPPHCRGGTSFADSPAAIPDRISRPSGLLPPAKIAPWSCLAYCSHRAAAGLRYSPHWDLAPDNSLASCSSGSVRLAQSSVRTPVPSPAPPLAVSSSARPRGASLLPGLPLDPIPP